MTLKRDVCCRTYIREVCWNCYELMRWWFVCSRGVALTQLTSEQLSAAVHDSQTVPLNKRWNSDWKVYRKRLQQLNLQVFCWWTAAQQQVRGCGPTRHVRCKQFAMLRFFLWPLARSLKRNVLTNSNRTLMLCLKHAVWNKL